MPGTPLSEPADLNLPVGTLRNAYDVIKGLEARSAEKTLPLARMLGWLLVWLPTEEGKHTFAADILRCLVPDDYANNRDEPPFALGTNFLADHGRDSRLLAFGKSIREKFVGVCECHILSLIHL